ncbi:MAG: sensor histidine kinase [Myxococcota bacterium]
MTSTARRALIAGTALGCTALGVGVAAVSDAAVPGWAFAVALGLAALVGTGLIVLVERPWNQLAHRARELGIVPRESGFADGAEAAVAAALEDLAAAHGEGRSDLAAERERFASVLEGMREGLIALSPSGEILLCNRPAMTLLGWTASPIGEPLVSLLRVPALHERLLVGAGSGPDGLATPAAGDVELAMADGRLVQASVQVLGRAGLGNLIVLRDVTGLRKLETMRRDFVSNVSHELRTPVATIRAAAETMLYGALEEPEVARDLTETVLRHAERLSRLLSDMLDLSRIEAGAYELDLVSVPVAERLAHAARLLEETTLARRQKVTVTVDGRPAARGSAAAIDQILFNLLDNASKYTPEGSRLELTAKLTTGDRLLVRVADDGPGIPLHQRERIFERFYRIDAGRSRQLGGTGLGLSIVKHLAEAMGGRVGVAGNEPRGAVFWLDLPSAETGGSATDALESSADRNEPAGGGRFGG